MNNRRLRRIEDRMREAANGLKGCWIAKQKDEKKEEYRGIKNNSATIFLCDWFYTCHTIYKEGTSG
jgi:hypothetical protein